MAKKEIKGNVIPTTESVVDVLKYLKNEFADRRNLAIEITSDGEVYGGYQPSFANAAHPSLVAGSHGGYTYGNSPYLSFFGLSGASEYLLRKMAKNIIEHHIWVLENGF